jgi:hypothetical protein
VDSRALLLYKSKDFDLFRSQKSNENIDIFSITPYIHDTSLIEDFYEIDILDISAIAEFNNRQYIAEQVIPKFPNSLHYICDEAKWELISFDLRYIYNAKVSFLKDSNEVPYNPTGLLSDKISASRTLFFYEKDNYHSLEMNQIHKGMTVLSLSSFVSKIVDIGEVDVKQHIIDITVITGFSHPQLIAEEYIPQFPETTLFICDQSKREALEYLLRMVFKKFVNVIENILSDQEAFYTDSNRSISESSLKHRRITDLNEDEYQEFISNFKDRLYGHPKFKDDFDEQIKSFRVFNRLGEHKILSLFLMGDSGVGKTEVARLIFDCMKGAKRLAKINFGNYSNEFSLSSLIGSARGYIGSDDGEIFMKVRDSDVGILLIDEFEKSNSTLFNYFLDVLESGKMTSSMGEELDLNGFIIVFTSNISKENYKKMISPELRSRFDYKCMFTLLGNTDKLKYVEFRANSIVKKLNPEADEEFRNAVSSYLISSIDVSGYSNMRDINKEIKKVFVQYLSAILK